MYTQKELIKNAISSLHPVARKYFVYAWLEDINWHSENQKFCEKHISKEEDDQCSALEMLMIALHPRSYSKGFVDSNAEELIKYNNAANKAGEHGLVHFPNGSYVTQDLVRDFKKAQNFQQALSYMTGWGINGDGWTGTSGDDFLKDLDEMFAEFDKADEEKEKHAEAYRRLND